MRMQIRYRRALNLLQDRELRLGVGDQTSAYGRDIWSLWCVHVEEIHWY
jgi:hypothetical protein